MKRLLGTIIALITAGMLGGCATEPGNFKPFAQIDPPARPPVSMVPESATPGSLFSESNSDMFTDLRAKRVGDLIVVEIVENAKAKKKSDSKAERKNNFQAGIPYMLGFEDSFPRASGGKTTDPLIAADFRSKHDTKAEIKKEDTMTASIGCTVLEVLPNGNMVIRGSKEVHVNQESQFIILQGIIRPSDVTSNNTVLSTQLANATIKYTGRGVLNDKQKPGWLARLLDHIWPF